MLAGADTPRHRLADRLRAADARGCCGSTSPANPTGRVLPVEHLRKVVDWCRERGTLLVSDECYIECALGGRAPLSVLDPTVNGGSLEGILAVHSLSKRSNLAGYRCAFVAGDPALVGELLAVRKNLGLQMPGPQQARDDRRPRRRRARRRAARALRRPARRAARGAGGRRASAIDHSEASLYLWATRGRGLLGHRGRLAERGILVAPGDVLRRRRARARPGRASPRPTSGSPPRPAARRPERAAAELAGQGAGKPPIALDREAALMPWDRCRYSRWRGAR